MSIRLTSRQVREFKENVVWQEIEAILRARIRFLNRELGDVTKSRDDDMVNKGCKTEVSAIQAIPDELLGEAEAREREAIESSMRGD